MPLPYQSINGRFADAQHAHICYRRALRDAYARNAGNETLAHLENGLADAIQQERIETRGSWICRLFGCERRRPYRPTPYGSPPAPPPESRGSPKPSNE